MWQDVGPLPWPCGCFHRGPQDGSLLHVPASSSLGSSTSISSCSLGSPVPGPLCGLLSPDSRQMVSRAAAPSPPHARAPVPRPLPGAREPKSSAGQAHIGGLLTALLRPTRGHSSGHGMVLTPGPARLPPRQLPNHPALQGVGSRALREEPPPNLQPLHRYTHTRTPPWEGTSGLLGFSWQMTPEAHPPACRASASARPVPHGWQKQGSPTGAGGRSQWAPQGMGQEKGPAQAAGASLPLWPSYSVWIKMSPRVHWTLAKMRGKQQDRGSRRPGLVSFSKEDGLGPAQRDTTNPGQPCQAAGLAVHSQGVTLSHVAEDPDSPSISYSVHESGRVPQHHPGRQQEPNPSEQVTGKGCHRLQQGRDEAAPSSVLSVRRQGRAALGPRTQEDL